MLETGVRDDRVEASEAIERSCDGGAISLARGRSRLATSTPCTCQPSFASRSAIACPIPLAAPVTSADLTCAG